MRAPYLCKNISTTMEPLNLPPCEFKLSQKEGRHYIFDVFRKMPVVLTPEEWVRQHFLMWLVNHLGYPKGLIAVETAMKYNQLQKRADAVVYTKSGQPLMLIECKAPHIKITQQTFEQVASYNFTFKTRYLVLTNGLDHYCCRIDLENRKIIYLQTIPMFDNINQEETLK